MTTAVATDPTHVVVATLGSAGDMYPFLSLATAELFGKPAESAASEPAKKPEEQLKDKLRGLLGK